MRIVSNHPFRSPAPGFPAPRFAATRLAGPVCAWLALLLLAMPGTGAEKSGGSGSGIEAAGEPAREAPSESVNEVFELRDPDLIGKLWEVIFPDSAVPPGEYQVLLPAGPEFPLPGGEQDAGAFLLRNGTMEGRMDRAAWEQAAASSKNGKVVRWKEDWEEPESEFIPTVWPSLRLDEERLLRWTGWPAGIRFQAGSSLSAVPAAKPQFERTLDLEWSQKLYRHFLLGAAIHRTEFGGGLVRNARAEAVTGIGADTTGPAFWTDPYWWWSVSAGVPGARYTLYLADRPMPPCFWLETRAAALIENREAGRVVRQWSGSGLSLDGNHGHSLDFRLAYLRYRIQWDSDAYAAPVHAVELDELPAFFGSWGAGFVTAANIAATRVWLDIPDFAFNLARPTRYPSQFRFAFLHFDVAYRNLRNFHLGVAVSVRLDNPILNFPGAGT